MDGFVCPTFSLQDFFRFKTYNDVSINFQWSGFLELVRATQFLGYLFEACEQNVKVPKANPNFDFVGSSFLSFCVTVSILVMLWFGVILSF